jgi:hypothetical protein
VLRDDAQNNDTNAQYTDDITTGVSVNLLPWKKKKTGCKKRKNGPDVPALEYQKVEEPRDSLNAVCDSTLTTRSMSKVSKMRVGSL